jgi:hypothetical protein
MPTVAHAGPPTDRSSIVAVNAVTAGGKRTVSGSQIVRGASCGARGGRVRRGDRASGRQQERITVRRDDRVLRAACHPPDAAGTGDLPAPTAADRLAGDDAGPLVEGEDPQV